MKYDKVNQGLSPIDTVLPQLKNVKPTGTNQWQASCPAHKDGDPSFHVSLGRNGRVLMNCKCGCTFPDICLALDLDPSTLSNDNQTGQDRPVSKQTKKAAKPKKPTAYWCKLAIECADAITTPQIEHLANQLGLTVESLRKLRIGWHQLEGAYSFPERDSDGNVVGISLRATNGSKRFVTGGHRGLTIPNGWHDADGITLVVEGASDVAAAMTLGLRAIGRPSNTGGEALLAKLLDGQEFLIVGENDKKDDGSWPGQTGAIAVATGIAKANGCPVRYAMPPIGTKDVRSFLNDPGVDIADSVACYEAGQRLLKSLVDSAVTVDENVPRPKLDMFRPFPVEEFPEPIRSYIIQGASAIGCDVTYLALPMISALASAIGNTRRIQLKRSWSEPSIIWTAFIGESGTKKSPPIEIALRPIRNRQREAMKKHIIAIEKHEADMCVYESNYKDWLKKNDGSEPPKKPVAPIADRCWIDDTTIEALAVLLQHQPRGLLMVRDELASWFGGMDRYTGGKGGDAPKWLEMHGGRPMMVDRKGGLKNIYVERAAVSLCGGIQPAILRRALRTEYRENGLAARLLMAYPPAKCCVWSEVEIDTEIESSVNTLFDRLFQLKPDTNDDGDWIPHITHLSPGGKKVWVTFYDEHAKEQAKLTGDLAAVWSKLEGYAARIALVIHMVRAAANDPTLVDADAVDEISMAAGITLARWFGYEAQRIYATFSESDDERRRRKLIELIQRKGENITVRELQQLNRRFKTADAADKALCELVKDGYGQWIHPEKSPKGGRSKRVFQLFSESTVYGTPIKQQENIGCADVDNVDDPQNVSEQEECGEI